MIKTSTYFNIIVIVFSGMTLGACQGKQTKENTLARGSTLPALQTQIIQAPNNTFGYNILKNGKIYIHQPHIPAVPGNEGFKSENKALKTAAFVISKIERNISPPTVSAAELDSLGVLD